MTERPNQNEETQTPLGKIEKTMLSTPLASLQSDLVVNADNLKPQVIEAMLQEVKKENSQLVAELIHHIEKNSTRYFQSTMQQLNLQIEKKFEDMLS